MRIFRLTFAFALFIVIIYFFNNSWNIAGQNLPPLGNFLNPFQGYLANGEDPEYRYQAEITTELINDEISVFYDSLGVPHIFAKNNQDLAFAQGYVQAKHRLWQMEFQIMASAGRVSEIIGKDGLSFDRQKRRTLMKKTAQLSVEKLKSQNPDIYEQLENYSKGVNAYINSLSYADLPIEYKLLNYEPEKWTPLKSVLLIQYMTEQLLGNDADVENTQALALLGRDMFNILYPDYAQNDYVVVPTKKDWVFDTLKVEPDTIITSMVDYLKLQESPEKIGSNNWAVSGNKTKSGHPILAGDPHLGLNLPSLWFLTHLNAPGINVAGFSFAGSPSVVIGFNEHIAWSFTNAPRDQRDWYRITYEDESKEKYYHAGLLKDIVYEYDTIRIKGEEAFIDTIRITDIGPVVFDERFPGSSNRTDLAFKWIGNVPSLLHVALHDINLASNYTEFEQALKNWTSPSQNAVFASTNGDIAMRITGKFPLKWEEQGKFILDASRPLHDWQGFIPHDQNPFQLNPERNYVSSANQQSVDRGYPYYVYNHSLEYYRNQRINKLLDSMENITLEDMMHMQNDDYSVLAESALPFFLDSLDRTGLNAKEQEVLKVLEGWNYQYDANSLAPTYFEAWFSSFRSLLWDELKIGDTRLRRPSSFRNIELMKTVKDFSFTDIKSTTQKEDWNDLIRLSFTESIEKLNQWEIEQKGLEWMYRNRVKLTHLARLPAFSTGLLPVSGGSDMINAFNGGWGPSMRLIVEMSNTPVAYVSYPGGQSGNPGSPLYLNYLDRHIKGEYFQLSLWKTLPKKEKGFTQKFIKP